MTEVEIPRSENREWGFYGTITHHAEPEAAWDLAFRAIAAETECAPWEIRAFLDSRDGRHFADHAAGKMTDDPAQNEAAIRATAREWARWTIGPQTSRTYGIPRGLPYLTGFVVHAGIEAGC